jgi:phosphoglucomutase
VIVNVKVREKKPLDRFRRWSRIRAAEDELKDTGRVVIRYSGTEALARVMIEAESEEAMRRHAEAIAAAINNEMPRFPAGQTLLIDADDTLWENNIYFERAIAAFISFLDHHEHSPRSAAGR